MEQENMSHLDDDIEITDMQCEVCETRNAEKFIKGIPTCSFCEYSTAEKMQEYENNKNVIPESKPPTEKEKEIQENKTAYGKKLLEKKEVKTETEDDLKNSALRFLMKKIDHSTSVPDEITFELSKIIFWIFFKELVFKEKGIAPVFSEGGNEVWFLERFVKWLIGEKSALGYFPENEDGLFDPSKSLFIWGELGTGKSTIVLAGHLLLGFFKTKYGWKDRMYDFKSLDELFLSTYTKQSLSEIGELAKGGFCMDELREEHLNYKHYGKDLNIINDILSARHNLWKRKSTITIITSNVSPNKLPEIIDDERLIDRLQQQYIFVELSGSNKRKIKEED